MPSPAFLPLLKSAVIPVMLVSIFLRNRRQRRLRAEKLAAEEAKVRVPNRLRLSLASADAAELRGALERLDAGDPVVSPSGEALKRGQISDRLADVLCAEGAEAEAEALLANEDRWSALLRLAVIHAGRGDDAEARQLLSRAADLRLNDMRGSARGDIFLLAERLVEGDDLRPARFSDSDLEGRSPLGWLVLAGRAEAAQQIATDLTARIDRALRETEGDPSGKVDGYPRAPLTALRDRLAALAV